MKQEKREFELSFPQERVTFIKTENFLDDNDIELGKAFKNIEKEIRMGFIRKVYGILTTQLALTTIMCIFSMISKSWAEFQIHSPSLMWFFLILSISSLIILACVPGFVRNVPSNYIVTGVFTVSEGYLVSLLCSVSEPRLVFMAVSMTFCLTAALTVYACTTKTDFTVYNSALFIGVCCLFLLGIFLAFSDNTFLNTLYCSLGIFIYSIYLIVDTQMICDTGKYSFESDDYLLAAINLYIDVINLFLYILKILKR